MSNFEFISDFEYYININDSNNFYILLNEILNKYSNSEKYLYQSLELIYEIISLQINNLNNDNDKISFLLFFLEILASKEINISKFIENTIEIIKKSQNEIFYKKFVKITSESKNKQDLFKMIFKLSENDPKFIKEILFCEKYNNLIQKYSDEIWNNLLKLLENNKNNENNNNKIEILESLNNFIIINKNNFSKFSNVTLYNVLEFLTENDKNIQIITLKILNNLTFFFYEDLKTLKENILEFIDSVSISDDEKIINLCNSIKENLDEDLIKKKREKNFLDENEENNQNNSINLNNIESPNKSINLNNNNTLLNSENSYNKKIKDEVNNLLDNYNEESSLEMHNIPERDKNSTFKKSKFEESFDENKEEFNKEFKENESLVNFEKLKESSIDILNDERIPTIEDIDELLNKMNDLNDVRIFIYFFS